MNDMGIEMDTVTKVVDSNDEGYAVPVTRLIDSSKFKQRYRRSYAYEGKSIDVVSGTIGCIVNSR